MTSGRLLIFNPDTDYALASGSDFYTPPSSVMALMDSRPFQAASWGKEGDIILLDTWPEESSDNPGSFEILTWNLLGAESPEFWHRISSIEPWGWNQALRRRLVASGCPEEMLPTLQSLRDLRELAHRRTTIAFNKALGLEDNLLPVEIHSEEECIRFWKENPGCWFKAPWSSSGRGVICTDELTEKHIKPWCRGIIRRQGSVMAEKGVARLLDFASEWDTSSGEAVFLGLSLFTVSGRGKYQGNIVWPQPCIFAYIEEQTGCVLQDILDKQKRAIDKLIAGKYRGLLGMDMLAGEDGTIRPCVEINLRRTMGHLSIL